MSDPEQFVLRTPFPGDGDVHLRRTIHQFNFDWVISGNFVSV